MKPTLGQIAGALAAEGLGPRDRGALRRAAEAIIDEPETHAAPWFVRAFVAAGTWAGGVLLTGFLVALDIHELPALAVLLGLAMIGGAAAVARRWRETVLRTQLVWVLVIAGQFLVLFTSTELWRSERITSALAVALQVGCVAAVPDRSLRALCAAALVIALSLLALAFELPLGQELLLIAGTAGILALWIHESRIGASRAGALWLPVAYAVPAALAVPHVILVALRESAQTDIHSAPWTVSVALALMGLWVVWVAMREQAARSAEAGAGAAWRAGVPVALAVVLVAAATREVPGVTTGLLLLVVAHLRRRLGLEVIALAFLAGFLAVFYYQLSVGLLAKSLWILASGGVLLGAALVLDRLSGEGRPRARLLAPRRRDLLRAGLLAALCLAIVAGLVAHKERLLATGRPVYLALAPQDPRSLIQGDYMVLRYALAEDILARDPAPGRGTAVVALDPRGVARLARLDQGAALAAGEQRLRFEHVPGGSPPLRIGAESFFFEEGTAERYAGARYGKLVVDAAGRSVLVGLHDQELRQLGSALR